MFIFNIPESFLDSIRTFQENTRRVAETFRRVFTENYKKIVYKLGPFFEAMREFAEVYRKYLDMHQRFSLLSIELGWPPHELLIPNYVIDIVNEYDTRGVDEARGKIRECYIELCSPEIIQGMVETWENKRWLQPRIPILRQAILAHNDGNYYAAVTTFLSQIEGIIADGFAHQGWLGAKQLKCLLEKALEDKSKLSFDVAILQFVLLHLYADFARGSAPKSDLSRHAILHGSDTSYGTLENSLKCILLIDYLQARVGFVTLQNAKSYHVVGCSVVTRHSSKPHAKLEPYNPRTGNKLACKICKPTQYE
ncbi:hypothetical protein [Anaerospora hongkongensis]|uniref:hypothetical protein n=1 Tax=Anaerospora hongkongensis TaxID=244830 RepID=UPI00289CD089|nr:hypothetical protein [Anaerospora hongkongensis]